MASSGAYEVTGTYRVLVRAPSCAAPLTIDQPDDGWREVATSNDRDFAFDHYRETVSPDDHLVILRGPRGACLRFGVMAHGELLDVPTPPRRYAPQTAAKLDVKVPKNAGLALGASIVGNILGRALAQTPESRAAIDALTGAAASLAMSGMTPRIAFKVPEWQRPRDPVEAWTLGYEGAEVTGDQLMRWFCVEVGGVPALLDCVEAIGDTTTRARFASGGLGDYYPCGVVRVAAMRGTTDPAIVQQRLTDAAAFVRSRLPLGSLLARLAVRAMIDRTHRALTVAPTYARAAAMLRIEPVTLRERIAAHLDLAAWAR